MSLHANHGVIATVVAVANLVVRRFIGIDGNLCAAGAQPIGVSINATDAAQACAVVVTGIAILEVGAAVTAGAPVASDATGRAINAVGPADVAGAAKAACGVALEAATAAGQFIRVKL